MDVKGAKALKARIRQEKRRRVALYCERRVRDAATQDGREAWLRLADRAWRAANP